jgi:DNA polymerase V
VFLKYVAPEDIHTYSIDESFLDVTPYLKMYGMTAKELAVRIIEDIKETVGTVSTCGIGTNLYLAKIALDIKAKHMKDFIGVLDEEAYRAELWDHRPITDFWQIAAGKAARLKVHGIQTMREVAMMDENLLYDWFGIDAELLIDHAWGRESTTMADIKAYKSKSKSMSSGQVLMRDYHYSEGLIIAKEMMDQLCLDMAAKNVATDSISLFVGYSYTQGVPGAGGTANLGVETNTANMLVPAIETLYRRIVDPRYVIRRVCISCNNIVEDHGVMQLNMFEDTSRQLRGKAIQEAILGIRAKYGKNSILKGMNYDPAATGRERKGQIGGHRSGKI